MKTRTGASRRDRIRDTSAHLEADHKEFLKTRTIRFPGWLLGPPKGEMLSLRVEDFPKFGQVAWLELDAGRTAFLSIDMQGDFCAPGGYVDTMGYDLGAMSSTIPRIASVMKALRNQTQVKVIHTREGHSADLSDAPYNKLLRSKLIGAGVGIGDRPPGGLGRLLIKGELGWEIVDALRPHAGEPVVDKPTKGALTSSSLDLVLRDYDISYVVLGGVTTDVCVHSVMRELNDRGYWCILLKDCTAATDRSNHLAAIRQIKMSGGIFGWVSDSEEFLVAISRAFKRRPRHSARPRPADLAQPHSQS
jgi:nicotinamidase-related amidase